MRQWNNKQSVLQKEGLLAKLTPEQQLLLQLILRKLKNGTTSLITTRIQG